METVYKLVMVVAAVLMAWLAYKTFFKGCGCHGKAVAGAVRQLPNPPSKPPSCGWGAKTGAMGN